MTLEEAIQVALSRSKVFRDLGGVVIDTPSAARTAYDPAVAETDPRFGVDGALSRFDAQWATGLFVEKNDRALNNQFFGGGTRLLKQDLGEYRTELSKRTATGSLMTVRNIAEYDFNNAPANFFPNGAWTMKLEAEARQPLLQGRGVDFNRIAGPDSQPGVYQGVLIARVNTDVALADFEAAVRDMVMDVESAYWELHFGYADLEARTEARDRALLTWQRIESLAATGQRGGEASREAQARAQYHRLQEEVQNAFAGLAYENTRNTIFRGTGGVLQNERRLRLMLSLPVGDGQLIRPSSDPQVIPVVFAWDECVDEALARRVELRRQRWQIQRRELELVAARNYLLPRLDAVGRYRWRGFGHELIDTPGGNAAFDNALEDLVSGDFQEVQMGVEYRFSVGYRQAHAAVRQAQLALARERALEEAQEREVVTELSSALTELDRSLVTLQSNQARRDATAKQLDALQAVYDDDITDENQRLRLLDLILDAQRNLADAESRVYRCEVEYHLALRQIHYAKGSLFDYDNILLTEGAWSNDAYADARRRAAKRRPAPRLNNYLLPSREVSRGPIAQHWGDVPESVPLDSIPENPAEATSGSIPVEPTPPAVPVESIPESVPLEATPPSIPLEATDAIEVPEAIRETQTSESPAIER